MQKVLLSITLVSVIAISFLAGTWYVRHSAGANPAAAGMAMPASYACPMHPQYKSSRAGDCPICGMKLEAAHADELSAGVATDPRNPAGTVEVTATRRQMIGVKVETAARASAHYSIRIPGRVAPDENHIYRINAAVDGWVKNISSVTTGSLVRKNDLLASVFAPESASAMKAYLYGLRSLDRVKTNKNETKEQTELSESTLDNYRNSLRNLGMSEYQLDEIQRTKIGTSNIEVRAPADGFIIARNVTLGQRFERGTELFRISDLSHIWILADVFGREADALRPGMEMRVTIPDQDTAILARVSEVLPQFDPSTRTLKVRLEADNPRYRLRPDMFVDVQADIASPAAITIPADALLDSGLHKRIFIERGSGEYEPREVATGSRFGDRIQILQGIEPGERVVVSGTFLIDSESRMRTAQASANAPAVDPVCGMHVDRNQAEKAGRMSSYHAAKYYFCNDGCKRDFDKAPDSFLGKPKKI